MTLPAEQIERLELILTALEPESKSMRQKDASFVRDTIERFDRYGINVRVSPKQMDWLESLYRRHVDPTDRGLNADARRDTLED